jgi:signal transduction histidine kinase
VSDAGFTPHVQHHAGNPGDERTKKLWELWAKVSEADQAYRKAVKATADAEERARWAREQQQSASKTLAVTKRELDELLGKGPDAVT